jgi:hypothetical protein
MRARFELADVVNLFGDGLGAQAKLTPLQLKVLGKIALCRTAALGGHEEVCDTCHSVRYSYNSCGDRQRLRRVACATAKAKATRGQRSRTALNARLPNRHSGSTT